MKTILPGSKFLIITLTVLIILTAGLLVIFRIKQPGVSILPTNSEKPKESIRKSSEIGSKKILNTNINAAFYYLDAVLTGEVAFDPKDNHALGSFYLSGDSSKKILKFDLYFYQDTNGFYIGETDENGENDFLWSSRSKEELVKLYSPGKRIELRGVYYLNTLENAKAVRQIDSVFDSLVKSGEKETEIPANFVFKALSIGFK